MPRKDPPSRCQCGAKATKPMMAGLGTYVVWKCQKCYAAIKTAALAKRREQK